MNPTTEVLTQPNANFNVLVNVSVIITQIINFCQKHNLLVRRERMNQLIISQGYFSISVFVYTDTGKISVNQFKESSDIKTKIRKFDNYLQLLKTLPLYFPTDNYISPLAIKDIKIISIAEELLFHEGTHLKYVQVQTNKGDVLICLNDLHESKSGGNISFMEQGRRHYYLINPMLLKTNSIRKILIP